MTERSVHHLRQGIESRFLGFAGPQLLPHPGLLQTPVDHFDGTRARESCRFPRESSYNSSNRSATWKTSADAYVQAAEGNSPRDEHGLANIRDCSHRFSPVNRRLQSFQRAGSTENNQRLRTVHR